MSEDTPKFERKIIRLPGTKLTPEVVLHRTLTKLAHIKAVTVIIQWDDDSFDCDWSSHKLSDLCMGSMVFNETVRRNLMRCDGE
jgi:hypothetical protein